jgi:hypothetical protein
MQVSFNVVHHLRWPAESLLRYNHEVLSFLPDLIPFGAAFLIDYLRLYLACFPALGSISFVDGGWKVNYAIGAVKAREEGVYLESIFVL